MHTNIVEIFLQPKILTSIYNEVELIFGSFFIDHKHDILVWNRLIVKTSSNVIWASVNACIWINIFISGISQENVYHELSIEEVSNIFWDFDITLKHYSRLSLNFRKIEDTWLGQFLFATFEIEYNLFYIKLSRSCSYPNLSRSCGPSNTLG